MSYQLSKRSRKRLEGVHPKLQAIVEQAICFTKIDFAVTCGVRTLAQQRKLYSAGKSQTMKSKHLTGHAVDVVALQGREISWDAALYDDIADAFKAAAIQTDVGLQWGGAWEFGMPNEKEKNLTRWHASAQEASDSYIALRRLQRRRPFLDMPHFNLFPEEVGDA